MNSLNYLYRFSFFLTGLFFVVVGCKKQPEYIGLNLVVQDTLQVRDTIFSVYAYSVVEDSVLTDETSVNLLGSMYTDNFGLTVASIYTHLRLSTVSPKFGENPQFDSACLTLVYSGHYGNITTPQTIRIYEVDTSFYVDSTYFSNRTFSTKGSELASYTFIPNPTDSVQINDTTKVSAQLMIPLPEEFANKILLADSADLTSNNNFLEYFKGIKITADSVNAAGDGAILYFNLLNSRSKLTIFYNDTLSYDLIFNNNSARVGNFYHNYSKSLNQNFREQIVMGDTSMGEENLYLQGIVGIKTHIRIPDISDWVNQGSHSINEARLIIPLVDGINEELDPAEKLVLFKLNEDGSFAFTPDQLEGDNYFGGEFSDSANLYQFRITFYLQDLINGASDDGLALLISGKTINANEVVMYGTLPGGPEQKKMKLRVIYTLLDKAF